MNLKDLAEKAYTCSRDHGFYEDGPPEFGMRIALMHSELSEALEDFRSGREIIETWFQDSQGNEQTIPVNQDGSPRKPCGIPSEMADVIIRILDFCGANSIDIETAVSLKMAYNETRPHKHGRKC